MQHAVTLLARNPAALTDHLSRLPSYLSTSHLLWTLSPHPSLPPNTLNTLTQTLRHLSPSSIGCLTAPVSLPSPTSSVFTANPTQPRPTPLITCSLAFFDPAEATLFRSAIPGRTEVQVGRSPGARRASAPQAALDPDAGVDWEDVWSRSASTYALPDELEALRQRADDVHTVVFFTDNAPQGLMSALSAFPSASKLGLIASSTPFITGRPFTLTHNAFIFSSGAVGLALSRPPRPTRVRTAFPGLTALTGELTVTRSEGNLIQELDHTNPSRILLTAIQASASGISGEAAKEHEYYLGVRAGGSTVQVHHVLSGDPARGTVALASEVAPPAGCVVQLFHGPRTGAPAPTLPPSLLQGKTKHLSFITASPEPTAAQEAYEGGDEMHVLEHAFLAASENGFLLGNTGAGAGAEGGEPAQTWTCTVPGGVVSVEWA
ncbi:hypothetical protein DENSPDRAFT_840322 [Dentipellis sp. KUC8613]|nr:hypothetical protein DENSPDRAFT_840322 [Dentipellis sp. KUC8613]